MAFHKIEDVKKHKKLVDFENNTNISLRHQYVYFAVDKVANSSIKNSLFEIELFVADAETGRSVPQYW